MDYDLIVICIHGREAQLEFDLMSRRLKSDSNAIINKTKRTIITGDERLKYISQKSNMDALTCKEFQLSPGLSRKATAADIIKIQKQGNSMRMGAIRHV